MPLGGNRTKSFSASVSPEIPTPSVDAILYRIGVVVQSVRECARETQGDAQPTGRVPVETEVRMMRVLQAGVLQVVVMGVVLPATVLVYDVIAPD